MSSAMRRITPWWHSHFVVVNNKACSSVSLYVPKTQSTHGPTFSLHSHHSKTRWPISVVQTLLDSSWDRLGPCFVKESAGTMSLLTHFLCTPNCASDSLWWFWRVTKLLLLLLNEEQLCAAATTETFLRFTRPEQRNSQSKVVSDWGLQKWEINPQPSCLSGA